MLQKTGRKGKRFKVCRFHRLGGEGERGRGGRGGEGRWERGERNRGETSIHKYYFTPASRVIQVHTSWLVLGVWLVSSICELTYLLTIQKDSSPCKDFRQLIECSALYASKDSSVHAYTTQVHVYTRTLDITRTLTFYTRSFANRFITRTFRNY